MRAAHARKLALPDFVLRQRNPGLRRLDQPVPEGA